MIAMLDFVRDREQNEFQAYGKVRSNPNQEDYIMTPSPSFTIENQKAFDEYASINHTFSNAATNEPVLEGFQVNFTIEVSANNETKTFEVVFQSEERNNGLMAYNGYEMQPGTWYGCDGDDSGEVIDFCDGDSSVIDQLRIKANAMAKQYLNENE